MSTGSLDIDAPVWARGTSPTSFETSVTPTAPTGAELLGFFSHYSAKLGQGATEPHSSDALCASTAARPGPRAARPAMRQEPHLDWASCRIRCRCTTAFDGSVQMSALYGAVEQPGQSLTRTRRTNAIGVLKERLDSDEHFARPAHVSGQYGSAVRQEGWSL